MGRLPLNTFHTFTTYRPTQGETRAGGMEAVRMLDVFASVGVRRFDISFTDINGMKRGYRHGQQLETARRSMRSTLIASCTDRGTNIIVRPHCPPPVLLVQLDDLDVTAIERVKAMAFLTLTTSPGNYQSWIAVQDASIDFARRLRKGVGADMSASGAARLAGSKNFKPKYAPNFPTVFIVEAQLGRIVSAMELEGLAARSEPVRASSANALGHVGRLSTVCPWPSYERCVRDAPLAHNSDHPDISRADFTWCLIAADWGHGVEAIATRLMELSRKARANGERYAMSTAQRAANARRPGRAIV